ncbi:MAG: BatA domain-containing protein, partial [Alphaproteobacteria bacterium]|nr:BatA domain-containing protein [Alphaproteobacteria bacterium]
MLSVGLLSFTAPWILAGLVTLPILWWLLRAVPPAPRRVSFPAIRLLFGLEQREETPHRTPWWLLLLRLCLAAL